jgi:hypothetical protein
VDSYTERLWPSWWLTAALGLFLPAGFLILLPLNPLIGLGVGAAMWLGSWAVLAIFSPVISIDATGVKAGPAFIGWDNVSSVDEISAEDARAAKGVGLDARAFVVIRQWVKPAIRLHVADPEDPTPYWLVSTTRPGTVAEACRWHLGEA